MKQYKWFGIVCASLLTGGALFLLWLFAMEWSRSAAETKISRFLDGYFYRQALLTLQEQDPNFVKSHGPLAAEVFRLNNDLESASRALSFSHSDRQQTDWDLQRVLLKLEGPKWNDQLEYALFLAKQNPTLHSKIMEAIVRGCLGRMDPQAAGQWIGQWKKQSSDIRCQMAEATLHEFTDHQEESLEIYERLSQTLNACPPEIEAKAGSILLALNKPDKSITHLNKALELLSTQPDWMLQKAKALVLLGQTDTALELLNQILANHEQDSEVFAEKGKLLLLSGKAQNALADLEKALALEPGNVVAAESYRKALFETGNESRAGEWKTKVEKMRTEQERLNTIFQKELPLRPQDPNLMAEAAGIFLRSGHPKSALAWAKKALAIDPNCMAANSLLAGYYEAIGNPGLAAEHKRQLSRPGDTK